MRKRLFIHKGVIQTLVIIIWTIKASEPDISTSSLIQQMVDLRLLAEFPQPYFDCDQFSSYDRRSKSSEDQEAWFANNDRGHYLRVEERNGRKEYVMMDATGPGTLIRIWSANPEGTLRIYLDDQEDPIIEAPMADVLGGKYPIFPEPIAGVRGRGWNLYFPIPYAKRCVVTSDKGDFYYHVDYRTYEPGTKVKTFSLEQAHELADQIRYVQDILREPWRAFVPQLTHYEEFKIELLPEHIYHAVLEGPAAISRVELKVDANEIEKGLRETLLRVYFDDELCIESPLGDFFGTGPGVNQLGTLPLGMKKEGEAAFMYCNWFMPFQRHARIELINYSGVRLILAGRIGLTNYNWNERSMYFHAKWKASYDMPTRPMVDWNYMRVTGKGVFVGVSFGIDNPSKAWWGEGDEKIYVDDDVFPSFFGTGTEDYYGYAWGSTELFNHAYHSQSRCDGPANYGRTSVNRFHILDRIPFKERFIFDMELWHWDPNIKVNLYVITYWYAKAGGTDNFVSLTKEAIKLRPMPKYEPPRVKGAIEGEQMRIVAVKGTVTPQDWPGLSGEQHLWWHEGIKPGDQLVLGFNIPKAGKYRVFGRFLTARDYGVHQIAINGRKVGDPIDFYNPEVRPTSEIDLGSWELNEGENYITVTIIGANSKAIPAYMFGLDYIRVEKIE